MGGQANGEIDASIDRLRRALGVRFMRIGGILLGLEPNIEEVSKILRTGIGFAPAVYRSVEDPI